MPPAMAQTITLTKLDDAAEDIISRFARETGLDGEDTGEAYIFEIEDPDDHDVDVTQTLDSIDPDWPEHVGLADPA
jgi:hypothetical protein